VSAFPTKMETPEVARPVAAVASSLKTLRSREVAIAVAGGRFPSVAAGLASGIFKGATRYYTDQALAIIFDDPVALQSCQDSEKQRQAALIQDETSRRRLLLATRLADTSRTSEALEQMVHLIEDELLTLAQDGSQVAVLSPEEMTDWNRALLIAYEKSAVKAIAFTWQITRRHAQIDHAKEAQLKVAHGASAITAESSVLFGEEIKFGTKTIQRAVKNMQTEAAERGRPPSMPRVIQRELTQFARVLRKLKSPVYKCTIIDYGIRLLAKHEAKLEFMRVDPKTGEYVRDKATGRLIWDLKKWDNWYYRRFVADAAEEHGSSTGNQRKLDATRAKWGTHANMMPHYDTLIACLLAEGIAVRNEKYDEDDKDEAGVPKEPQVLLVKGQEWRLTSMDETRLEDTTHGSGGDRHSHGERIFLADADDDGEVTGTSHASHTASGVGGSNAGGEALPCFVSFACETFEVDWLKAGPVTMINGKKFSTQGTCNTKGSVNGDGAIQWSDECLKPAYDAHGGVSATRRGVMCADGVGTHLTLKFLKHLDAMHVRLVLRTPNCSHKQQVEDLYNFWVLKNGASKQDVLVDGEAMRNEDAGWYKVKQLAVQARLHTTGRADLPFDQMMKLLKPVWERAFLPKGNLIGWRMAGLNDKGGVTARPAWLALKEAEKADAAQAGKKPAKKRKAEALSTEQLGREAEWSALTPAHAASGSADQAKKVRGTRVSPGDFSKLGFPANSGPGMKWAKYLKGITTIKGLNKPKLLELLGKQLPGTKWKSVDAAVVLLVDHLSTTYAKQPTMHDGVSVDDKLPANLWEIKPSHFTAAQQKAYRLAFPERWAEDAERDAEEEAEEEEEEFDPFAI
jgi:hypothetical protein